MLKLCKYRKIKQPETNFETVSANNGKTYRRLQCRTCKQAQQNKRRQKIYTWLVEYKKTLSCSRCGFADYRALEFHHLEPNRKDFAIADFMSRGASSARISKEIKKCVVLCANCHRIEHYSYGM
jgi:hypothetical protein